MEVKFFSLEEWISEKMLKGCPFVAAAQAAVTWHPYFKDISGIGTFGAISDKPQCFKVIAVWFYHIRVIDRNDRFSGNPPANQGEIGV